MFCTITTNSPLFSKTLLQKKNLIYLRRLESSYNSLHLHLQIKMFYKYELDPNNNMNINFDNLLKKVMAFLGTKKK